MQHNQNNQLQTIESLRNDGFCVVRVYDEQTTQQMRERLYEAVHSMPEFLPNLPANTKFVGGGFGAFGNSASFHHPVIRQIRADAHKVAKALFQKYYTSYLSDISSNNQSNMEQLVDRLRILRTQAEITAELWHRDQTPMDKNAAVKEGDLIFGGWISFDNTQRFSAIKGSHRIEGIKPCSKGFTPLTKEEGAKYTKMKLEALEAGNSWYIEIPPGCMLIFQQEMIHEVVGGKHQGPEQYRLFTGWRITSSTKSFIQNPHEFFEEQGVTNIKSDQTPDMYPTRPWSTSPTTRKNLVEWSKGVFQPYLMETRQIQSGQYKGETHRLVPQHMYSLYEIAIKKAAYEILNQKKNEEKNEEITMKEMLEEIVNNPPKMWRKKLLNDRGNMDFLNQVLNQVLHLDRVIQTVMYVPYTEEERALLKPTSLF